MNPIHPYATKLYAESLPHVGEPYAVPEWGTHLLMRHFDVRTRDVCGPYPLCFISGDANIGRGLARLKAEGMVSVSFVTDELIGVSHEELTAHFRVVRPFKMHYLVDQRARNYSPSEHHKREIRRAYRRGIKVELLHFPDSMDRWVKLYDGLVARHGIDGAPKFPRASFERLAQCDGLLAVGAFLEEELVAAHLWIQYEETVWSHLAATSVLGYKNGASYAVYDFSIRSLPNCLINLGGPAGSVDSPFNGLAIFKEGFSNSQRQAYLYGEVLDNRTYRQLCADTQGLDGAYFPAYRAPKLLQETP